MESLSKAGLLYLKDFVILNQARKDVDEYLNDVVEQVYGNVRSLKGSVIIQGFDWGVWQNKSTRGHLEINITAKDNIKGFRKDKPDVYIMYNDIRCSSKITDPLSVQVNIWSPSIANGLKRELSIISKKLLDKDIYESTYIDLNVESSSESSERIMSSIIQKFNELSMVIDEYVKVVAE